MCGVCRYAVEGAGALDDLDKGDVIESVKVLNGLEFLQKP
jgi:hypothetical protein